MVLGYVCGLSPARLCQNHLRQWVASVANPVMTLEDHPLTQVVLTGRFTITKFK
jgi:hypothetical protein